MENAHESAAKLAAALSAVAAAVAAARAEYLIAAAAEWEVMPEHRAIATAEAREAFRKLQAARLGYRLWLGSALERFENIGKGGLRGLAGGLVH